MFMLMMEHISCPLYSHLVEHNKFPNNYFSMNNSDLVHKYRFQKYIEDKNLFGSDSCRRKVFGDILLDTGCYFSKYFRNQFIQCCDFQIFIQGCISCFVALEGVYLHAEIVDS